MSGLSQPKRRSSCIVAEGFIGILKGCDFDMKTKKQQELVDSFLDALDNELGSLYREIVMYLSELGYYPRKQRSYIVFKHDLHNREMAKIGMTQTKDGLLYFSLRFSACKGYSERFANVIRDYINNNPNKLFPHCENGRCVFRADGERAPYYEVTFRDGETQSCCGAKALVIPNDDLVAIEETKRLIKEEHNYLMKHEAGIS